MKISNQDKNKLLEAAVEQWVNILFAHFHTRRVARGIKRVKNKHE